MYFILTEVLAIVAFIAGYMLGKRNKVTEKIIYKTVEIDEEEMDPISPEDQQLFRKLEEAAKYGIVQEEEEDY